MIQRSSVEEGEGGRTILVGVKLDAPSRELLTWALVKVAEPGDTVIALHILGNGEETFLLHKALIFMCSVIKKSFDLFFLLCRDC